MDHFEKYDKQLISSYESTLAAEGGEICKEIDSIAFNNDELLVEKAIAYCHFISKLKSLDFDPKLVERCKKYLNDMSSYKRVKSALKENDIFRKMV